MPVRKPAVLFGVHQRLILWTWVQEHFDSPYPSASDIADLATACKLDTAAVVMWFGNHRRCLRDEICSRTDDDDEQAKQWRATLLKVVTAYWRSGRTQGRDISCRGAIAAVNELLKQQLRDLGLQEPSVPAAPLAPTFSVPPFQIGDAGHSTMHMGNRTPTSPPFWLQSARLPPVPPLSPMAADISEMGAFLANPVFTPHDISNGSNANSMFATPALRSGASTPRTAPDPDPVSKFSSSPWRWVRPNSGLNLLNEVMRQLDTQQFNSTQTA